jgi:hypothetical protein
VIITSFPFFVSSSIADVLNRNSLAVTVFIVHPTMYTIKYTLEEYLCQVVMLIGSVSAVFPISCSLPFLSAYSYACLPKL